MSQLIKNECFQNLLNTILITLPVQELRKKFVEEFKMLLKCWNAEKDYFLLTILLGKLLNHVILFKNKDQLKEYFELTS